MTPERFCDWLQGYAELDGNTPTPDQWKMIKEHLSLVYNKITSTKEEILSNSETKKGFKRLTVDELDSPFCEKTPLNKKGSSRVIC